MTLVVDESEDVSSDLLSILLASVRKDNQVIAWCCSESLYWFSNM